VSIAFAFYFFVDWPVVFALLELVFPVPPCGAFGDDVAGPFPA
jgi:hypothetical protein